MKLKHVKSILKFCLTSTVLLAFVGALPFVIYLYVLPYAVSNPKVINYAENIVEKAYPETKIEIKNPYLKTSLTPEVEFGVENLSIYTKKNPKILTVQNFDTSLSLKEILKKKNIIINMVEAESIFVDVNKLWHFRSLLKNKNLKNRSIPLIFFIRHWG